MTSRDYTRQNGRPVYYKSQTLQAGGCYSPTNGRHYQPSTNRSATMPTSILKNGSGRRQRSDVTSPSNRSNTDAYRMTSYKRVCSTDDAVSESGFPRQVTNCDDDVTNQTISKRDWISRSESRHDDKQMTSRCGRDRCVSLLIAFLLFVVPVCTVFAFSGVWLVNSREVSQLKGQGHAP